MPFNPLYSLLNTINLLLRRKIHFTKENIGKVIVTEDNEEFVIFRDVKVNTKIDKPAVFKVKFLLSGRGPENNIRFSWLPIPFFIGLPGFKAKVWTLNYKNNYFQGIYEGKMKNMPKSIQKHLLTNL